MKQVEEKIPLFNRLIHWKYEPNENDGTKYNAHFLFKELVKDEAEIINEEKIEEQVNDFGNRNRKACTEYTERAICKYKVFTKNQLILMCQVDGNIP
jgi:hypothetical protein